HIEEGLPLPVNEEILTVFKGDLREIRGVLEAKKATFKAEDIGKVSITRFPPCMYNLLAQIQNHENVPHMGRFAIVAFLHHIGLGNEEIYRVFGDVRSKRKSAGCRDDPLTEAADEPEHQAVGPAEDPAVGAALANGLGLRPHIGSQEDAEKGQCPDPETAIHRVEREAAE